ncbi:hypothetical protein CoNPh26_CDS0081 [Staphylococcus phage S-CoN_Ph26]|nr:hypothetical protein CoNPh26_CDS0081 [Staphylococcus phage S-CoN_Ph26]
MYLTSLDVKQLIKSRLISQTWRFSYFSIEIMVRVTGFF